MLPLVLIIVLVLYCPMDLVVQLTLLKAEDIMRKWSRTMGTVSRLDKTTGIRGQTIWKLSYTFTDSSGNVNERASTFVGGREAQYKKGSKMPILYDPVQPTLSRAEPELKEVGILNTKTGRLRRRDVIKERFIVDTVAIGLSIIVLGVVDALNPEVFGLVLAYLIMSGVMTILGVMKVKNFLPSQLERKEQQQ